MDLTQLDTRKAANEGRELVIVDPATGLDTDIKILLAGQDSDIFQKLDRKASRERFKRLKQGRQLNLTPEEIEDEQLQMLVACTLGWSDLLENGQPVTFSATEAKRIYRNYPIIRRQVAAFIGAEANFLSESPTSSPMPSEPI